MTKTTVTLLAAAALAAGCAKEQQISLAEARAAVPEPATIRIDTPKDTADGSVQQLAAAKLGAASVAAAEAAPTFDPGFLVTTNSEFARWSYVTAWTVNGGAWWTLTLIRVVTLFPPTSCQEDTCTWGPWEDGSAADESVKIKRWKLVVTKVDEGEFRYTLSAMNLVEPGPWLDILSGTSYPTAPGRGHGTVVLSFDNARQLPEPEDDHGVLTIHYDNREAVVIDAELVGARDEENGNPLNAVYAFDAGARDLQVAFEGTDAELNPVGLSLHTRWDETGAGRGDARVFVEDQGGQWQFSFGASECWLGASGSFQLSYDTDPEPVLNDSSATYCGAFAGAPVYSDLTVPAP